MLPTTASCTAAAVAGGGDGELFAGVFATTESCSAKSQWGAGETNRSGNVVAPSESGCR